MPIRLLLASGVALDVLLVSLLAVPQSLPIAQLWGFLASTIVFWLVRTGQPSAAPAARLTLCVLALAVRAGLLATLVQAGVPLPLAALGASLLGLAVLDRGELGRRHWRSLAVGLVCISALLRLCYAATVELLPEETYYWNYSQHLALGYLDHPPVVAWLIRAGTSVFGDNAFGVRAGALCCGLLTSYFIFRTARDLFGSEAALAALLLANALPFFFLAGMIITPDAPLTACWAASVYFLQQALVGNEPRAWWRAGVALGIGLISKYTIVLLGTAAGLYLLCDPSARRQLRTPGPWLALLLAALLFSPVIIWNAQNEWASFSFQTARRLAEAPRFSLHKLILSALVLITPTGVAAVIWAFRRRLAAGPATQKARNFLLLSCGLPLLVFFVFSLRHEVKLDWTGAPWTGALPLLGGWMVAVAGPADRLLRIVQRCWEPTLAGVLLLVAAGFYHLSFGIPGVGYGAPMELAPVGWRELAHRVSGIAAARQTRDGMPVVWVGMDRYAIASELAFYGRPFAPLPLPIASTHLFEGVGLMYERWAPAPTFAHRTLLLISDKPRDLTSSFVRAHSGSLGEVEPLELQRGGRPIATLYYRFVDDYRPVAAPPAIP